MNPILAESDVHHISPKEALAIFSLCIQSFPEFDKDALQLFDSNYRITPSEELTRRKWICTFSNKRWKSHHDGVDWAYTVLQDSCVNVISSYTMPVHSFDFEIIGNKFIFDYDRHQYYAGIQEKEPRWMIHAPYEIANPSQIVQSKEASGIKECLEAACGTSTSFFLRGSLIDTISAKNKAHLRFMLNNAYANSQFLTYNTDSSYYLMQIAAQLMDRSLLPNVTDTEILDLFLPWGSRTILFHYETTEMDGSHDLCFCYIKPLSFYPPIRLEFRKELFLTGEHESLLDKLVAHIILNPYVVC